MHPWFLSTVSRGYRLQFATKPTKFNGVLVSTAKVDAAKVLENEIMSLLRKQVIRAISIEEAHQGFDSRYFLIPKKGGASLYPILDLRVLNTHLRKLLTSLTQCLSLFRQGKVVLFRHCLHLLNFMASIISVVHLGLLMRDFQRWVAALRLTPRFSKVVMYW